VRLRRARAPAPQFGNAAYQLEMRESRTRPRLSRRSPPSDSGGANLYTRDEARTNPQASSAWA
jgi:hypothetical protein